MFIAVLFLSPAIVTAYETNTQHDPNNNNAMLGVHASASAIIQYGKIGRKQVTFQSYKLLNQINCECKSTTTKKIPIELFNFNCVCGTT